MSKITVKCPTCSREITVKIKTIDTLREQLARVTAERDGLRLRLHNDAKDERGAIDALRGIFER